ncbi:MAG: hypothetical protein SGILL_002897 [Bacillariaceae sp.]
MMDELRPKSASKNAEHSGTKTEIVRDVHPVVIGPREAFLWKGAQSRLCDRFKDEKKKLKEQKKKKATLHSYLQLSCDSVHQRRQHGNFLVGFYSMKLAALHFGAGFSFRCNEDFEETLSLSKKKRLLLWWLQSTRETVGGTKARTYSHAINETLYDPPIPSKKDACQGMGKISLQYTSEYVRKDLRAMATELTPSFRNENKTLDIDEAAIHFRCGDVISSSIPKTDNNYGLLQFQAYQKRIPENVTSIGIVTAPFTNSSGARKQDRPHMGMCQSIVERLVSYLQQHFPGATIQVRNDPHESIPKVMSRLILANYTFCARSTFCLYPAVASFGTSYVQEGGVAYFFDAVSKAYDNIHLMRDPFLRSAEINEKGFNYTLEWLVQENSDLE